MQQSSRRRLLASVGAIGLGGCLSFTDDESGEESGGTDGGDGSEAGGSDSDGTASEPPTPTASDGNRGSGATPDDGSTTQTSEEESPTQTSEEESPTRTPEDGSTPGEETPAPVHEDYETTAVTVRTAGGESLGSVTAAIADTRDLRYLGLSDTESLPEDRGMLFVFDSPSELTFVMRRMSFGIDIVYADADGVITGIHHAPAPGPDEDGSQQRYPGYGQYVLEVNRHWTTDRGVEEGDVLDFEL
jgi:uncharacterized membrane protein (UPF0127 family)